MGTGRKKGPGGGGASLNFKVKDYATEELLMAATGKDNEIGIITSTPMTGWHFAAEQPEMQPGEVWISTGTASQVAFNALKKGTIMVYPLAAKQMGQDGTLVDVTAKSWQDGEWVDWWNGQLFVNGNQFESVTGGWKSLEDPNYATHEIGSTLKYHYASDVGGQSAIYTVNKIDLTDYKTLRGQCVVTRSANWYQRFGVFNSEPVSTMDWNTYVDVATGTLSVDISAFTGKFHVGFGCAYYGGVEFTKIWLE